VFKRHKRFDVLYYIQSVIMDFNLNDKERLNLKNMIDESHCENNTDNIRKLKHSVLIRDDIRRIDTLKKHNLLSSKDDLFLLCKEASPFLFENYADIFKKVFDDEIDLEIMTKLLMVLKMIEDGKVDQHEGSVVFGKVLKELYIDSAIKHADNLDKDRASTEPVVPVVEAKPISWKEYKMMNSN